MSQTLVVLEDDAEIRRLIQYRMESAGYLVRMYSSPAGLIADAKRARPALFLLDIMVPGGSGLDVCRQLRREPTLSAVPVIFLTARASEDDRVLGLELGADDYIVKPFGIRELLARVRAVLRRSEAPGEAASTILTVEDLQIDSGSMQVRVRGELITTTTTEFRLLEYLARRPGRVFSRDQLLDAVWGDSRFVTPRSVDVYVRRLREKIETEPETPRFLKTLRGAGYRFDVPATRPAMAPEDEP